MRQSWISSSIMAAATTLFSLVILAAPANAKKMMGSAKIGEASTAVAKKGVKKFPTRHQANIKFGDMTVEASKKKKKTTRRGGTVHFEDVHVGKEIDKASPRMSQPATPGAGGPLGGSILDSQGGLGATGPANAGGPSRGGAAPGPVFR